MTGELSTAAQRTWSFSITTARRRRIAEAVHQPAVDAYSDIVRPTAVARSRRPVGMRTRSHQPAAW
ncbi:hypothetical protein [Streptomyces morookaense]|uniref:Uncharacterized protein n=1 Tax=Streptomyces morookaense TaxID=1970 RepID=A0A7Y7E6C6_STRMO|nr:hypothetical protein [Streptomyces morookaense]NVK77778.1 hypothetical protein [Streptomyces morookaense]